jgi:membrane protease YdiL (CAAX protease family)
MTSAARSETPSPEDARARLAALGTGAAWLLGVAGCLELVSFFLGSSSLAEAVVGALLVDVAAGRAGIAWTLDEPARPVLMRRCLKAGAFGGAAALVTLLAALIATWARVHPGHLDALLLLSALGAVAAAIRDELLLRGFVAHAVAKAGLGSGVAVAFSALLSVAWILPKGPTPAAAALALTSGALFAVVYARLGGAWPAIAANASFSLLLGPFSRGGLVDLEWLTGELAVGASADGPPALVAAGVAATAALLLARLISRKDAPEVQRRDDDGDSDRGAREDPEPLEEADPR